MQLAHTVYIIFLAIGAQLPLIGLFILLRKNIQLKKTACNKRFSCFFIGFLWNNDGIIYLLGVYI